MDFWNRQLSAAEINEYYRTCDPYQGNLYSWTDLKFKTVGDIKVHKSHFCKPCDQNLTVDNGVVVYGDQTAFVKCSEGFKIHGSPIVFCLRTSKWELSKMPTCKIVKCSPLKTPPNGRLALTKISYNGQAKFTCEDGFTLMGSEIITCGASGNWSDGIPHCQSIYECPAMENPSNGVLIYASDSGLIDGTLSAYPVGTFVEIKCDAGFFIDGENLISCTDQGLWDFDVEDCQPEPTTAKPPSIVFDISTDFWRDFKNFLFHSCSTKNSDAASKFCGVYTTNFNTDLSSFELPETPEYEGMDSKLLKLLKDVLEFEDFNSLNVENFLTVVLRNNLVNNLMRDSYRFVICLYIDLILIEEEFKQASDDDDIISDNINENIKKIMKKIALPIYKNQLLRMLND